VEEGNYSQDYGKQLYMSQKHEFVVFRDQTYGMHCLKQINGFDKLFEKILHLLIVTLDFINSLYSLCKTLIHRVMLTKLCFIKSVYQL
jgi:hypothetical protein